MAASALIGIAGKLLEPLLKLFFKRYQQPKLYMSVIHQKKFLKQESRSIKPPSDYTLYREYLVTIRNNSEHNAYRLNIKAPEGVHLISVYTPRWEYHKPFLIHEVFEYRYQIAHAIYGDEIEAEKQLNSWAPQVFRIEYENVSGKKYYTEYKFAQPRHLQNHFGSG